MTDSLLYGGIGDQVRISNGKICIIRSTFEKGGIRNGDSLNCKAETVGDMAHNLMAAPVYGVNRTYEHWYRYWSI